MDATMAARFDRVADDHARRRAAETSFRLQVEAVRPHLPGEGARLLDLGCGSGALAGVLGRGTGIVGCDLSERMLRHVRGRGRPAVRADAPRLPFPDGAFEAVVSLGLLEYVPDPGAVLGEVARVLCPGGVAAISLPNPLSPVRLLGRLLPGRFDQDVARRIAPREVSALAVRAGLRVRSLRTANAALLPWPLDGRLPRIAAALAAWLRPLTERWPTALVGTQTVLVATRAPGGRSR